MPDKLENGVTIESVETDGTIVIDILPTLIKGDKGDKGDTGDKGDQGDIGPQGIQGIQGPKGDQGDIGPQGIQGIQGIQGDKGDKGDTGENGSQFHIGTGGAPSTSLGKVGDWYLRDTVNGDLYRKSSNTTWAYVGTLKGSKGDKGNQGDIGPQGQKGDQGDIGPQGIQGESAFYPVFDTSEEANAWSLANPGKVAFSRDYE